MKQAMKTRLDADLVYNFKVKNGICQDRELIMLNACIRE
jgi:hypothetical protein